MWPPKSALGNGDLLANAFAASPILPRPAAQATPRIDQFPDIRAGRPVTMAEVGACKTGEWIRVPGWLRAYDAYSNIAVLTEGSQHRHPVRVDCTLTGGLSPHVLGAVYMCIGEVDVDDAADAASRIVVHARILQLVDNLDVTLYTRSLPVLRHYLGQ